MGAIIGSILGAILLTSLVAWLISRRRKDQRDGMAPNITLNSIPVAPTRRRIIVPSPPRLPQTGRQETVGAPENQTEDENQDEEERPNGHINSPSAHGGNDLRNVS